MPEQYAERRLCNGRASFRLSVQVWAPSNNSAGASPAYAGSTTLPEYVAANQGLTSDSPTLTEYVVANQRLVSDCPTLREYAVANQGLVSDSPTLQE